VAFLVEPLHADRCRPFFDRGGEGVVLLLVGDSSEKGNELIQGSVAGMQAGTRADAEKPQRKSSPPTHLAIAASSNAGNLRITHRNREGTLGGYGLSTGTSCRVVGVGGRRRKGR